MTTLETIALTIACLLAGVINFIIWYQLTVSLLNLLDKSKIKDSEIASWNATAVSLLDNETNDYRLCSYKEIKKLSKSICKARLRNARWQKKNHIK